MLAANSSLVRANTRTFKAGLIALLAAITPVQASVVLEALDPSLELRSDCHRDALEISSYALSQPAPALAAPISSSAQLVIGFAEQSFSDETHYLIPEHALDPHYQLASAKLGKGSQQIHYYWSEQQIEWLQSFAGPQRLPSKPLYALSRLQGITLALVSAYWDNPEQLELILGDDFTRKRSPLVLVLNTSIADSQPALHSAIEQGFEVHHQQNLLILSKGLEVCDSGEYQSIHSNAWLRFNP